MFGGSKVAGVNYRAGAVGNLWGWHWETPLSHSLLAINAHQHLYCNYYHCSVDFDSSKCTVSELYPPCFAPAAHCEPSILPPVSPCPVNDWVRLRWLVTVCHSASGLYNPTSLCLQGHLWDYSVQHDRITHGIRPPTCRAAPTLAKTNWDKVYPTANRWNSLGLHAKTRLPALLGNTTTHGSLGFIVLI